MKIVAYSLNTCNQDCSLPPLDYVIQKQNISSVCGFLPQNNHVLVPEFAAVSKLMTHESVIGFKFSIFKL
jgi:hypothetical protein